MVLGRAPSIRESQFDWAPLLAASPIVCTDAHECADKQGCVGESVAGSTLLGIRFILCLGRIGARGRPLSYGGE